MDDLGHCPLCGCECEQNHRGIECTECSYCLDGMEKQHNRLSAMGELWRLLEWARTTGLHVYITAEDEVGVQGPYSADFVSESSTLLDALREAKKELEELNES